MMERRRRKKSLLRKLTPRVGYFAILVLLAAGLTTGAVYWGFKLLRDFRAKQMAAGAREYLAQGKVREALLRAQSALTLTPEGPEAWRSMAAVMDAIGNPLALGCYEKVVATGAATSEDRQNYLQAAMRLGQDAAARQQAAELEKAGDGGFSRLVSAEAMMNSGNVAAAENELRGVPGSSAVSRSSKLVLAHCWPRKRADKVKPKPCPCCVRSPTATMQLLPMRLLPVSRQALFLRPSGRSG